MLVVAAMVAPVVLDRDDFPLSTYPMYSRARLREQSLVTAVGVDAAGDRSRLSLQVIGASDDPLIVAAELRSAIADDRADEQCAAIAARLAARAASPGEGRTGAPPPSTVAVEVVTERVDVVAEVLGEPSVLDRTVHARCDVESSG